MANEVNWVVMPVRAGYPMTIRALQSIKKQTVPTEVLVIANGSDAMVWMPMFNATANCWGASYAKPISVAKAWNRCLRWIFEEMNSDHALVVNNDVELLPETYELLLKNGSDFVTGIGHADKRKVFAREGMDPNSIRPHPDFSCFLMRRKVWEEVGPFDEKFEGAYGEDCDYDMRMHKAGIRAIAIQVPYFHIGSGTLKALGNFMERKNINHHAESNRAYFLIKWGVDIGSEEYYELLGKRDRSESKL